MEQVDVLVSFDVTGSMAPAIRQVQHELDNMINTLFVAIPNIRIGMIAHGDYCDGPGFYQSVELTQDKSKLLDFVRSTKAQGGGDAPECYEYVLNKARSFNWTAGTNKALVLIGDDEPHTESYSLNKGRLWWENEARLLHEAGVNIYPVQALGRRNANYFYDGLAQLGGRQKLVLDQFSDVPGMLLALCFSRANQLEVFENTYLTKPGISVKLRNAVDTLAGRKTVNRTTALSKFAVHPSRFQVLSVRKDTPIKDFVVDNDLRFNVGRGFYEFTKPVLVQDYKEVIVEDKETGEMFSGPKAREILGIPSETAKAYPSNFGRYRGFVQSTSNNRKLLKGTKFLYEVDDL